MWILTKMNNLLIAIGVDRICFKITMQHITLWMQNNAKMSAQHFKFHLLDNVERMVALLCSTLYNAMNYFVRMNRLIIMQIFTKSSFLIRNNI